MINYIHPLDVSTHALESYQFVDLYTGRIGEIPSDAPMPAVREKPSTVQVRNGSELVNAVKRSAVMVELTQPEYLISEPLVFGHDVDLVGAQTALVRIVADDGFKGNEMVSITQQGAGLNNVDLVGRHLMVNGVQLEDAGDVLIKRCRLQAFQRNCLRMLGNTNHVAVLFCDMMDTKSNHGIGMRETVSAVLIASSAFHHCGTQGDNDGFGLDLHGLGVWSLGNVVHDNHRGVKLPDAQHLVWDGGYVDDGVSHKYPPIAIWKSNESYGRRPNDITITNVALDSLDYHIGVWNADIVRYGNIVPMRNGKTVNEKGEPIQLSIKGSAIRLPSAPDEPLVEPPAPPPVVPDPDAPDLDALAGEVLRRLDVNELAHLVGQRLVSSLSELFR
ncbi:MAG: hypothetical protein R3A44_44305 [Caldilineaceae bacterium]